MDILPIGVKLNAMLHPIKVLDAQTEKNSRSGIFSIRCKLSLDSKTERLMPLSLCLSLVRQRCRHDGFYCVHAVFSLSENDGLRALEHLVCDLH